jgi:hypothetical protein
MIAVYVEQENISLFKEKPFVRSMIYYLHISLLTAALTRAETKYTQAKVSKAAYLRR